jgi:hypothetical protein
MESEIVGKNSEKTADFSGIIDAGKKLKLLLQIVIMQFSYQAPALPIYHPPAP